MALYTFTSRDEFAKLNRMPNPDQTQLYNALSGNTDNSGQNDNFFVKRGKSIENALGTTASTLYGAVNEEFARQRNDKMLRDQSNAWDDLYKQYGFKDKADYDRQVANADDAEFERLINLPGLAEAEKNLANTNRNQAETQAADYKDYVENNYASKKINQDRGKFAGSAINTLSTATDVLGLTNGPVSNAIQGGIEGVADELEQNGLENFDWERAKQNAIAGAASGAVVGELNKGINSTLAKRGGNLFKGGNKLTRSLNALGSSTPAGRIGSTIATGAARGAVSGAVGGATGAGVSAAMNGQDVLGSAFEGAKQGLGQGAVAGGVLSGANMALNKTPFMQRLNQAQEKSLDQQKVSDNMATNTQKTSAPKQANTDLMYGESELGNRTRRGMVSDSLERFGNTLEGAQTNITRAAAKDLGIESTGKVVENIRKKTGIANLETQAKLARELTGGENSLMDNIQRRALTSSEDGRGYRIDTTPVIGEIDNIVDKYADTNMFGSQSSKDRFIYNLKKDLANIDSDAIAIANRMKANASDLRGKGIADPAPADAAKAKIYTEVANKLDDLSYRAIPQENVESMFDTTISEFKGRANQARQNGNNDVAKAYETLATALDAEPRTIKAFRSFKKDFVDISKISELTNHAENGAAAQMGRSFGGGAKRFLGTVAQRPVNAALARLGGAVNSVADKIAGENTTPIVAGGVAPTQVAANPATQLFNAVGRAEGLTSAEQARTANYLVDAVQEAEVVPSNGTLESMVQPVNTNTTSVYNSVYGSQTPTSIAQASGKSYFQPTGDYWTDILGGAMSKAIEADDAEAFGALYGMYQEAIAKLESQNSSNSQVKLTDKQRQANAAERALNDFESAEHNFAYDVSDIPLIGGIANLGGNDYASKAEALALQIGYMLSGATVNKEEAKNIGMAYVPQPRDNEAVRQSKLNQIRGIISDYQKTYAD